MDAKEREQKIITVRRLMSEAALILQEMADEDVAEIKATKPRARPDPLKTRPGLIQGLMAVPYHAAMDYMFELRNMQDTDEKDIV